MKKMYDLYETYVVLHFNFISEYSQPIAYSYENGTFNIRKFLETFVGPTYQQCLGLGDVPETFYRFYVDFDNEEIYIKGTASEQSIPFSALDIEASSTKPIAERGTYTEEF